MQPSRSVVILATGQHRPQLSGVFVGNGHQYLAERHAAGQILDPFLLGCGLLRGCSYRTKYLTLAAARTDVFDYIERRHNARMRRRVAKQDLKFSALL